MLHLEFTVLGPPVSYQTRDKANLRAWMKAIRDEAAKKWTARPLTTKLKMVLINFHEGDVAPLDDDNMVKPVRDALNKLVYDDDRQITYSELIQVSIDAPIKIRRGSKILLPTRRLRGRGKERMRLNVLDSTRLIVLGHELMVRIIEEAIAEAGK